MYGGENKRSEDVTGKPLKERQLGRPQSRWYYHNTMIIKYVVWERGDWIKLAQDG